MVSKKIWLSKKDCGNPVGREEKYRRNRKIKKRIKETPPPNKKNKKNG